ncbi:hypothetical protein ACVWWN_006121 [Mycobacterium sp. URHB0021]
MKQPHAGDSTNPVAPAAAQTTPASGFVAAGTEKC